MYVTYVTDGDTPDYKVYAGIEGARLAFARIKKSVSAGELEIAFLFDVPDADVNKAAKVVKDFIADPSAGNLKPIEMATSSRRNMSNLFHKHFGHIDVDELRAEIGASANPPASPTSTSA